MATSTAASEQPAPQPQQGSHCYILTLEMPGDRAYTAYGTLTPLPGMTRLDAFLAIKAVVAQDKPSFASANTTFFSFEPNTL